MLEIDLEGRVKPRKASVRTVCVGYIQKMTEVALRKQVYGLSSHIIWDRLRLSDNNVTPPSYFRVSAMLLVRLQESKRVSRWGDIQ